MQKMKRSISLILTVVMLFSLLPVNVRAAENTEPLTAQSSDITVRGTNGFGALLSEDILEHQASMEQTGGYSVTDLVIEDNVAVVTYNSLEDATAVVALYTEDGMQLLLSGTAPVLASETMAIVEFEGDMPEYFMASAYLLDNYDFSPLCTAYDTPMYTKEMQDLLASTIADYDTDRVLNLDEDSTTNFAVYAETTKLIEYVEGVNTVVSADDETATYVIANADEQITSLTVGDIVAYPYGENEVLIVKVASITLDGTTATIIGAEVEMEEAFSHVKVEAKGTSDDMTYEDGSGDEGVSYLGMTEKTLDDAATFGLPRDKEYEAKLSMKFKLDKTLVKEENKDEATSFEIKINGSVELSTSVKLSYYVSLKRQFLEFRVESDMKCAVSIDAKLEEAMLKLGYFGTVIVPGVYVEFAPKLIFEVSAKVEFSFSVQTTIGFSYETGKGFQNLSTAPIAKCTTEIEGSVSVGIDLGPKIGILGGVVEAGIDAKIELVVSGKLTGTDYEHIDTSRYTAAERHGCEKCLDGDVEIKLTIAAWVEFLKIDALRFKITFLAKKWKLFDFYHSYDQDVRDFGECPYLEYRLTVYVQDETGASVEGAKIATDSGESWGTTNSSGILVKYVPVGSYALRTTVSGEVLEHSVVVTKATKITIKSDENAIVSGDLVQDGVIFGDIDSAVKEEIADLGQITASGTCGNYVHWELYSSGTLRIYGSGVMTAYSSASEVPWYSERASVKRVIFEGNVTSIGQYAFYYCSSLTSITIPDSVTSIGRHAFFGCKGLTSITIPDGVTYIGDYAFSYCKSLTSITIPDGVTYIGDYAFSYCSSLTSITIPDSVTRIGDSAFWNCSSLSSITIPDGVTYVGDYAFSYCSSLTSITIPDSVTRIGDSAFSYCSSLSSITIPDSVTSIRRCAFYGCSSLTSITIPDGVTYIDDCAFDGCSSLTSITIPDGVTSIGFEAFDGCSSLTSITIPNSVTTIDDSAFANCSSLTSIQFCGNAPTFGSDVFTDVTATAYYPAGNATWTKDVMQDYGGSITWVPYTPESTASAAEIPGESVTIQDSGTVLQAAAETESVEMEVLEEITSEDEQIQLYSVVGGEYGTEITDTYTLKTASFKDLVPGKEYVLLALVSVDAEDILAAENLLFIDQAAAAEDGTLVFKYVQKTQTELSYVMACGPSNKDLADATIVFPEMQSDGEIHLVEPVVTYDGKVLTENQDYVIVGDVDYTEVGEYICYIRGIYNYAGLVECRYTVVSEPEKFPINLAQVELGNALNLNFLFLADSYADWTGCYAVLTKTYADGRDNVVITVPADQWEDKTSGGKQYKKIGFHNISAKEMADEISILVYNADKQAISNEHTDSIVSYLERMLGKNSNAEFRTLAVDMLNYGAAAQTQFNYNLDNLANANIGDYQQYATATDAVCVNNQVKGDNVRGTSVSLENNIVMNVYFTNQTADMTAEVTFKNHAGTDMTVVLTSVDTSNGYCFQIDKLAVADMRTMVTITCKDADGNVYGTLTDSVEGYVARTGLTKAINQAIMKFADSAYAYLH